MEWKRSLLRVSMGEKQMFVRTFARIVALSSLVACPLEAAIADTIEYNGLPCNTWCQWWMGVSPAREASTAEQEPALDSPTNGAHKSLGIKKPRAHATKHANDRLAKGSHDHLGSPPVSPPAAIVLAPKPQVPPTDSVASTRTKPVDTPEPDAALVAGSANVSKESKTDDAGAIGVIPPPAPGATAAQPALSAPAPQEALGSTATTPSPVASGGADPTAISSQSAPSDATAPTPDIALPKASPDVASALVTPQPQVSDAQTAQSAVATPLSAPMPEQPAATPTPDAKSDAAPPAAMAALTPQDPAPSAEPTPAAGAPATAATIAAPAQNSEPEVAAISPSGVTDSLAGPSVLILLTGPEVKLLSDLGRNPIVVAGSFPVSDAAIEAALSLATSKSVKIVDGSKQDIDRVFRGEIGAAVVDVISLAQEKDFPKFTGLNVFFIPMPAR